MPAGFKLRRFSNIRFVIVHLNKFFVLFTISEQPDVVKPPVRVSVQSDDIPKIDDCDRNDEPTVATNDDDPIPNDHDALPIRKSSRIKKAPERWSPSF